MATYTLDFERPLLELERQIEELKRVAADKPDLAKNVRPLEEQLAALRVDIYKNLTPMQRVQVARHPKRPYPLDYVNTVFTDFVELHGDRLYRDDPAIVGGWARLDGTSVMLIGHQKGRDTKDNLYRNFGMAHPEGYRKAMRLMRLAAKFGAPVVTLSHSIAADLTMWDPTVPALTPRYRVLRYDIRGHGAAGIETVPAHPEHARSDHAEHHAMWRHIFFAEADAFAISPRHDFGDFSADFARHFGRQFFFANMVLFEKSAVIQKHEQLRLSLNNDREIGMRNQQMLADVEHRSV